MTELRKAACAQGGDTVYDFDEGKQGEYHIIIATIAVRDSAGSAEPEPAPAAPTETAHAGCQYDSQCKGDRICDSGVCVAPAAKPHQPGSAETDGAPSSDM